MTLRKTFEGDLKKMELTWGTAENEPKERHSWKKRDSCIILNYHNKIYYDKYNLEISIIHKLKKTLQSFKENHATSPC